MDLASARIGSPEDESVEERPRALRWTVDQFEAMWEAGFFGTARVELREGELVELAPQYAPHMQAKMRIIFRLQASIERQELPLYVGCEGSVRIAPRNMPQPDVFLYDPVRVPKAIPVEAVRLVIEICETSHREDLDRKPALYAGAGIPEYWVVDLAARHTRVMHDSRDGAYRTTFDRPFGEDVRSPTLGIQIATGDLD